MKKQNLAIAILASLSLAACNSDEPSQETTSYLPPSEVAQTLKAPYFIQLLNKQDNNTISDWTVKITPTDSTEDLDDFLTVFDATKNGSLYQLTGDTLSLALLNTVNTDKSIKVVLDHPEFYSTDSQITLSPDSSEAQSLTLTLTPKKIESTDTAITATESVLKSEKGEIKEAISLETPTPTDPAQKAAIDNGNVLLQLPAGTTVTDKNGNPVEGTLTANVTYFSNAVDQAGEEELSSLDAFPGGLSPTEILGEDGTGNLVGVDNNGDPTGTFISAGFAAIEISNENGDRVANINSNDGENGVPITFEVPGSTVIPDSGKSLKEAYALDPNITIPLWSYNEDTGQWKSEGNTKVIEQKNDGASFLVQKKINHLSYYNLDWYQNTCNTAPKINLIYTEDNSNNQFRPYIKSNIDGRGWAYERQASGDLSFVKLYRTPQNQPAYLALLDGETRQTIISEGTDKDENALPTTNPNNGKPWLEPIELQGKTRYVLRGNYCSTTDDTAGFDQITLTLDVPKYTYFDTTIKFQSVCKQDSSITTPQNGYFVLRKAGNGRYFRPTWGFANTQGKTLSLQEGREYRLSGHIYIDNKRHYIRKNDTITINKEQEILISHEVECEIKEKPTGTGTGSGSGGGVGA